MCNSTSEDYRSYDPVVCITFRKTNEPFGGLSNMAGGYQIKLNGFTIQTSEALYQACRFPHRPDVQRIILDQKSPMTAKMKSKPYINDSRNDWERVRTTVMRWALRAKLYCNRSFCDLLLSTDQKPIVEDSRRDRFWGAVIEPNGCLVGKNVLGRLLMELRQDLISGRIMLNAPLEPPPISNFLVYGVDIGMIECHWYDRSIALLIQKKEIPVIETSENNSKDIGNIIRSASLPILKRKEIENMENGNSATATIFPNEFSPDVEETDVNGIDGYEEMLFRLQKLGAHDQAIAIETTVRNFPEFRLSDFRLLLEKWKREKPASTRQKSAASILKNHKEFLDKLANPSLF